MLDLFEVQDEIARRIAAALGTSYGGALHRAEFARGARNSPEQLAAYDHLLRGLDHVRRLSIADTAVAKQHLRQAIGLDPRSAKAYATLAITDWLDYSTGVVGEGEAFAELSCNARTALEIDPSEPWAHWALAYQHLVVQGDHDLALASYEKALALNPYDADILSEYG